MNWHIRSYSQLTVEELHMIIKERVNVFVVEQQCPYPEVDGADPEAIHIWMEDEGQLAAYCRIFRGGVRYDKASIGRTLVTQGYRGRGYGRLVFQEGINQIKNLFGERCIQIQAQAYLKSFYESFGFQAISETYLDDGIPHIDMVIN
ncbi:GNAT family acetyltransferase [Pontibacillus halophilus JSM 076056 = DSM 19796]|uniref:GNAT family acetyltransferase n=1 Tax=Pontibacillus halophilus JSM 076056 = DSM 19796 TaxID=1385510 RepID=A0A0A5GBI6_9BACI|nr:GNAT family acetyltransferase [Pontibacillus halophilus JSM 076056 = DSM 19796]